uniref:Uncharacterized protein n=1 Tax=Oryza sativa subsp. japonica TaxID=39947 RepID=Q7EYL1_ORYSJ|nr:hypothetical protein [Oryza sativa Japonica Group]
MAAGPCRAAAGLGAASKRVREGYRAATQAGVEEEKRGGRTGATASGDRWEERPTARRDRLSLGPGKGTERRRSESPSAPRARRLPGTCNGEEGGGGKAARTEEERGAAWLL